MSEDLIIMIWCSNLQQPLAHHVDGNVIRESLLLELLELQQVGGFDCHGLVWNPF